MSVSVCMFALSTLCLTKFFIKEFYYYYYYYYYYFYYLRSGNGVGHILTAPEPTRGAHY